MTFIGLAQECGAVFGAAQALWEKGVKIYNVSEGGCLFLNPKASYLVKKQEERGSNILIHKPLRECVDFLEASE